MGLFEVVLEEAAKDGGGSIVSFQSALIAAVVSLFGGCCALLRYIAKQNAKHAKKVDDLYDARIADMQRTSSKVSTAEDVTIRQIGTRKKKKSEEGKNGDDD